MKKVIVVGGAVIDIFAQPKDKFIMHDSNPGYLKKSLGGVARNIAENLARLDIDTTLITVIGKDDGKKLIMQNAQEVMLKLSSVPVHQTPTYLSILDDQNDMVAAIADMDEIELLSKDDIKKRDVIFQNSDYVVLDTNLKKETIEHILKTYQNKEIYVDVISCQKAEKIKSLYRYIYGIKLNLLEAKYLSGMEQEDILTIAKYFIAQGVKEVYITLGKDGSLFMSKNQMIKSVSHKVEVLNTAGAGDAFLAGVIYAKVKGYDPVIYAQKAAILTLKSEKAVSELMNVKNLEATK
ncbi:MAG: carbohydrate kinase family protein [Acholeplasmataceae bacterium]